MNISERQRLFENPNSSYRGKPFWSWNGDLQEDELIRQIDIMKEMGFGGFFMHSRTGLETEYLGEKWYELTNKCADYGDGIQMESWLYDEDRWPSGTAGGIVTKEKKYRAMFLEMKQLDESAFKTYQWNDQIVAVFACRLNGSCYEAERKIKSGDSIQQEETVILFEVRYSECKDVYNGYTYLDTMNKKGVERYIEVTHEAYRKHCKERLGTKIKGIFTDEPHRGAMFSDFSEGREYAVPYTPKLFELFEMRFGYSLKENLLGLFLRKKSIPLSKVSADYIALCQDLFLESFAMPIQKWCHDNQMIFTGHVLHEDSLSAQTVMQGSLMRFYEYMDYPGIDILTESNECWWIVKQVESVARQLNKEKILSELYGGTGWQMNFENYKNVGDWQSLWGVNLRCPHLSWYTMKGEAKRDYPSSILHQSGWYDEYCYLEDYFSRIHVMMSEGEPDCELLVINPIESVWARSYSSAFCGLEARDEGIKAIEKHYQETFKVLMRNRIDFDYGEEDIIGRHGYIKNSLFHVGRCAYKKILVTGMETIRFTTLNLLKKFVRQGGKIIFAGDAPEYVDTLPSKAAKRLAEEAIRIPFLEKDVAASCKSGREIEISGTGATDIFARVKISVNQKIIMLLNMNRSKGYKNLRVCLGEGDKAEAWSPRTGRIHQAETLIHKGKVYIDIEFAKGEEKIYVLPMQGTRNLIQAESILQKEPEYQKKKQIDFSEKMKYRLQEDNIYVCDYVKVIPEVGIVLERQEVLRADSALRDFLVLPHRGGEMLQPWYQKKYRDGVQSKIHKVALEYTFLAEEIPEKMSLAVEDLEHIRGIHINGRTNCIISKGKWIDICFDKIEIDTSSLIKGENTIQILLDYDISGGLEAIYLLGKFGVYQDKKSNMFISGMEETLQIGDITTQGLPFYSGKVSYLIEGMEHKDILVEDIAYEGAYVKLIGEQVEMIACAPYRGFVQNLKEIEVGLTRRNTFGPLHRLPEKALAYGPETFRTIGEEWQDTPVLCAQGLMGVPVSYEVIKNGKSE